MMLYSLLATLSLAALFGSATTVIRDRSAIDQDALQSVRISRPLESDISRQLQGRSLRVQRRSPEPVPMPPKGRSRAKQAMLAKTLAAKEKEAGAAALPESKEQKKGAVNAGRGKSKAPEKQIKKPVETKSALAASDGKSGIHVGAGLKRLKSELRANAFRFYDSQRRRSATPNISPRQDPTERAKKQDFTNDPILPPLEDAFRPKSEFLSAIASLTAKADSLLEVLHRSRDSTVPHHGMADAWFEAEINLESIKGIAALVERQRITARIAEEGTRGFVDLLDASMRQTFEILMSQNWISIWTAMRAISDVDRQTQELLPADYRVFLKIEYTPKHRQLARVRDDEHIKQGKLLAFNNQLREYFFEKAVEISRDQQGPLIRTGLACLRETLRSGLEYFESGSGNTQNINTELAWKRSYTIETGLKESHQSNAMDDLTGSFFPVVRWQPKDMTDPYLTSVESEYYLVTISGIPQHAFIMNWSSREDWLGETLEADRFVPMIQKLMSVYAVEHYRMVKLSNYWIASNAVRSKLGIPLLTTAEHNTAKRLHLLRAAYVLRGETADQDLEERILRHEDTSRNWQEQHKLLVENMQRYIRDCEGRIECRIASSAEYLDHAVTKLDALLARTLTSQRSFSSGQLATATSTPHPSQSQGRIPARTLTTSPSGPPVIAAGALPKPTLSSVVLPSPIVPPVALPVVSPIMSDYSRPEEVTTSTEVIVTAAAPTLVRAPLSAKVGEKAIEKTARKLHESKKTKEKAKKRKNRLIRVTQKGAAADSTLSKEKGGAHVDQADSKGVETTIVRVRGRKVREPVKAQREDRIERHAPKLSVSVSPLPSQEDTVEELDNPPPAVLLESPLLALSPLLSPTKATEPSSLSHVEVTESVSNAGLSSLSTGLSPAAASDNYPSHVVSSDTSSDVSYIPVPTSSIVELSLTSVEPRTVVEIGDQPASPSAVIDVSPPYPTSLASSLSSIDASIKSVPMSSSLRSSAATFTPAGRLSYAGTLLVMPPSPRKSSDSAAIEYFPWIKKVYIDQYVTTNHTAHFLEQAAKHLNALKVKIEALPGKLDLRLEQAALSTRVLSLNMAHLAVEYHRLKIEMSDWTVLDRSRSFAGVSRLDPSVRLALRLQEMNLKENFVLSKLSWKRYTLQCVLLEARMQDSQPSASSERHHDLVVEVRMAEKQHEKVLRYLDTTIPNTCLTASSTAIQCRINMSRAYLLQIEPSLDHEMAEVLNTDLALLPRV